MITDKQVIEALKTAKQYCRENACIDCKIYDLCNENLNDGAPAQWAIPEVPEDDNE